MNLLEEIARALCTSDGGNWDALTFNETLNGETPEEMREGYMDAARSLLPLMEKAVQAGLDAGADAIHKDMGEWKNVAAIGAMRRQVRRVTSTLSASEIVEGLCGG